MLKISSASRGNVRGIAQLPATLAIAVCLTELSRRSMTLCINLQDDSPKKALAVRLETAAVGYRIKQHQTLADRQFSTLRPRCMASPLWAILTFEYWQENYARFPRLNGNEILANFSSKIGNETLANFMTVHAGCPTY